jgi:branched-chain amino acid transport system ATP-binding protein
MFSLDNVHGGYNGATVLRGVSITVPEDAVVALIGPNGAGKTTLLRVASGLLPMTSGRMVLDGQEVTGWSSDALARAGVCHVPEGRGIFRGLTVRENLRLQAPPGDPSVKAAVEAFPRLAQRMNQRAGSMSGGEQQMLALAHAYLGTPRVVLLDEVSMGLAPNIVNEIFDHLRVLASRGTSLLLVEQYVHRAMAMAGHVVLLVRGQVAWSGPADGIDEERITREYLGTEVGGPR